MYGYDSGMMFKISRTCISPLMRLCNRAGCGSGQSMSRSYHQSSFRKFLEYFTEGDEERFSTSGVARSHAWDRLDARHWMLIYRDANASRAYALVAVLFPTAMIAVAMLSFDFVYNEPNNRTSFVQKLCKDAAELGMLAAFPILCFVIVVMGLIRVQSVRLFRIYQQVDEPHRFVAIVPRSCILQQKMPFDRSLAVLLSDPLTDDAAQSLWRMFVSGTLLLNGRRFVHDDDCFRANNFRSFMLSQTNTPPRIVDSKYRCVYVTIKKEDLCLSPILLLFLNVYRRVHRSMSLTTCAAFLLFVIIVNVICCPCFITTRKGLLLMHWILANFLASKGSTRWREIPFDTPLGLLLPFATVILVVNSALTDAPRSCGMSSRKTVLTALFLLFIDIVFMLVNIIADLIVNVLLASALFIGVVFRFAQRKKPHLRKEKELLSLYHDDLFCDPFDIFTGSGGCLNYCVITASVLIKLLPSIGHANILLYLLYILRCLTSLQLLMVPAVFGGSIQSLKLVTKLVADWRTTRIDHRNSKDRTTFL